MSFSTAVATASSPATPPLQRFRRDRSGNISILFAFTMMPLLLAVGCAVDFSMAARQRTKMQGALDAAILAGSLAAKQTLDAGSGATAAVTAAKAQAQTFFAATYGSGSATLTPAYAISGLQVTGSGTASHTLTNTFMKIVGQPTTTLQVAAGSQASAQSYLNVYLLVDISTSMLLPSTSAGITAMRNATGCALACHDSATNNDSYGYALNNNIQLRYQVVNQGVQNLLTYLNGNAIFKSHVKVGLWSFDSQIRQMTAPTYNYTTVANNFPAPEIAVNDTASATPFDNLIGSFITTVGNAGDGSSAGAPQKMVIIATDGVNEPTRAWNVDPTWRPYVKVFNTAFCKTFEKNGVILAIINTPYYPMTFDWGYQATLGQPGSLGGATRVDDIPIALKACAGNNFVSAGTVEQIQSSFTKLFAQASPVRITD